MTIANRTEGVLDSRVWGFMLNVRSLSTFQVRWFFGTQ